MPLVLGPDGERLAKRHGAVTLSQLAEQGVPASEVVAWLAVSLGLAAPAEPAGVAGTARSVRSVQRAATPGHGRRLVGEVAAAARRRGCPEDRRRPGARLEARASTRPDAPLDRRDAPHPGSVRNDVGHPDRSRRRRPGAPADRAAGARHRRRDGRADRGADQHRGRDDHDDRRRDHHDAWPRPPRRRSVETTTTTTLPPNVVPVRRPPSRSCRGHAQRRRHGEGAVATARARVLGAERRRRVRPHHPPGRDGVPEVLQPRDRRRARRGDGRDG